MAYKYATGSTFRGDIYAEDDAQSNTYIDWTPEADAVGIVAGGTTMLVVSSSTVGVGISPPTSTFQVSGSEASNYTSFTANVTLNETHHVVAFTGGTGVTGTLPAVAACTGRIYHVVNSLDEDSNPVIVKGNASENIGHDNTLSLDAGSGNSSVMLVSNGGSWDILGKYAESGNGNGGG